MSRLFPLLSACALLAGQQARHRGFVTGIATDGDKVYSCSQAGVFVGHGDALSLVVRPAFRVVAVAACPGRPARLLLGGGRPGKSGELQIVRDGDPGPAHRIAKDLVYAVAIAPQADRAACALADGRILLLDFPSLENAREVFRHTAPARSVAFCPRGELLASGGLDRLVQISPLEGASGPKILEEHTGEVECVAFSPDGRFLVSGARDAKARLHTRAGRLVRTWQDLGDEVRALCWTANETVCVGLANGAIEALDAKAGARRTRRSADGQPLFALAAGPGGRLHAGARRVLVIER